MSDEIAQLTLSSDEIKAMGVATGRDAAHYGTCMHYLFEALLNGHSVPAASPEVRMLQHFLHNLEVRAVDGEWRTEWTIYGETERIAGSIDCCVRLEDGSFMLIDWKRTSGLPGKYQSFQSMHAPVSHMADCAGDLDLRGGAWWDNLQSLVIGYLGSSYMKSCLATSQLP